MTTGLLIFLVATLVSVVRDAQFAASPVPHFHRRGPTFQFSSATSFESGRSGAIAEQATEKPTESRPFGASKTPTTTSPSLGPREPEHPRPASAGRPETPKPAEQRPANPELWRSVVCDEDIPGDRRGAAEDHTTNDRDGTNEERPFRARGYLRAEAWLPAVHDAYAVTK